MAMGSAFMVGYCIGGKNVKIQFYCLTLFSKGEFMRIYLHRAAGALTLACLLMAGGAVSAQTLQPGLWEVTTKLPTGNSDLARLGAQSQDAKSKAPAMSSEQMAAMMAQMKDQIAKMPAEQRKMVEQNMAAMQNMSMNNDGTTTMKMCMTKEMIARNQLGGQHGKCTHSPVDSSGSTRKFSFVCTDPAAKGEGSYTMLSPTAYTGSMTINSVQNGKPQTMSMASSGKFLNADCGSVKPIVVQ
jgi:hypothetical protein